MEPWRLSGLFTGSVPVHRAHSRGPRCGVCDFVGRRLGLDAAGAFPGSPLWGGMPIIFGAYRIDNLLVDGFDIVVNRPRVGALRAPGATNAIFAGETVMDQLCEKLGIDPVEFRLLNGVREGDRRSDGVLLPKIGLKQCLWAMVV